MRPSVTEVQCECRYLERSANDPDSPIIFDQLTNEYQFEYDERQQRREDLVLRAVFLDAAPRRATLIIYHCPWCGGVAPKSKRSQLFHAISDSEKDRLTAIVCTIRTYDDAVKLLGPPDFETTSTIKKPEDGAEPPKIDFFRELVYQRLSDVAEVCLTESPSGKMFWHFAGKCKSPAPGT